MVLRDEYGVLLLAAAKAFGRKTNSKAEFLALSYGLKCLKSAGLLKGSIVIETDSKFVFNALQSNSGVGWSLWYEWIVVQSLLKEFDVVFSHIYREANMATDWLANAGVKRDSDLCFYSSEDCPLSLQIILRKDFLHYSYARK